MAATTKNRVALNLHEWQALHQNEPLMLRAKSFQGLVQYMQSEHQLLYRRKILSPADREVMVEDPFSGRVRPMLMFASNNYLGLANHPYVKEKILQAATKYGTGIGGPPLLNGFLKLTAELEERLAALKGKEAALIFSSGYTANLGLLGALVRDEDKLFYDELSHASFLDGIKLGQLHARSFPHNDLVALEAMLQNAKTKGDIFIGVEGIYSMDGDMAPLNELVNLCRRYGAHLMLDDAHGTGVVGKGGAGTAHYLHCEEDVNLAMGTFSKTFAVSGGFVAASRELVEYMRYHARSYIFSASLPPTVQAAVLAGLDVMQNEPERQEQLLRNVKYAGQLLEPFGLVNPPAGGIIALRVPPKINIREANLLFHDAGIFLNAIEYPAVPLQQERFRISLMCNHTRADIDYLAETVGRIWKHFQV
jgi:glycine C-acetyltransferase